MSPRTLLLLLAGLIALICIVFVRGGLPHEVHRTSGRIVALGADERGVFWLEGAASAAGPASSAWVLANGRGRARCVLEQPGLTAIAGAGEALVVLQREALTGKVWRVPLEGGAPGVAAEGLSHPVGLAVADGEAYWTETQPRLIPGARHIPATQARVTLRAARIDGQGGVRTVAWLRGGALEFEGEILGALRQRVYLLEVTGLDCGPGWSRVLSVPVGGGSVEACTQERGPQTALLRGDMLYWTAASENAGDPAMACSLNVGGRLPVPSRSPLTDWLPPRGRLCETGGRAYYSSPEGLWQLPERRALPRLVHARPGSGEAAGFGGAIYRAEGSGALTRAPRTLPARLVAGLRIR